MHRWNRKQNNQYWKREINNCNWCEGKRSQLSGYHSTLTQLKRNNQCTVIETKDERTDWSNESDEHNQIHKFEFYLSLAIDAVCELCTWRQLRATADSSVWQAETVAGCPSSLSSTSSSFCAFYLFVCLRNCSDATVAPPSLAPLPSSCSADPFLVRPAPERALLCDFWDCCCCCCCCCRCYFRQPHSALFHLNFRHAAFLFIDPKSR